MAFANNEVPFQLSKEDFDYRLHFKLFMENDISAAAFDGDEMVGFILHTSNIYQGIPTAYNGGTGVIPGFRNQSAAEQIYSYLLPKIRSKFVARVVLEVLENNQKAISLYEKIGFTFKRKFKCYKMTKELDTNNELNIVEGSISQVDFSSNDFNPSFVDSEEHLKKGAEKVLLAKNEEKIVGHLILQPHIGRISQVSVVRNHRGEGIGEALIRSAQEYTNKQLFIMNIPDDEFGFDAFLKSCGFENQVNQFEMELII